VSTRNSVRIKWEVGDEANKWVACISCDHAYFIESFELNPECAICGSKEYEEDNYKPFSLGDDW